MKTLDEYKYDEDLLRELAGEAKENIAAGRTYGPFDTVEDMFKSLNDNCQIGDPRVRGDDKQR